MTTPELYVSQALGAEFRKVENRDHEGQAAIVVIGVRTYPTSVEDLWDAVTNPDRIPRWFAPVAGDLRLGGRYQITGNAGGLITRCDPPEAFDLTWEFGGATSWVTVRITPDGEGARLTLEHIAHREGIGEEHLKQYGPGAVGIGWDLSFVGLGWYIGGSEEHTPETNLAWMATDEAKAFMRASGAAWGEADIAAGEDPHIATQRATRTVAFYTGT